MRNWTWISEQDLSDDAAVVEEIENLVREHQAIEASEDRRGWARSSDGYDEWRYDACVDAGDAAAEAEIALLQAEGLDRHGDVARGRLAAARKAGEAAKAAEIAEVEAAPRRRQGAIERVLARLGARLCRPYEAWNEEEKLVEYLETRYDYDR